MKHRKILVFSCPLRSLLLTCEWVKFARDFPANFKFCPCLILFALLSFNILPKANAQICGTSGIDGPSNSVSPVNTYFPVKDATNLNAGAKTIELLGVPPIDASGNNTFGGIPIRAGDLLLLIQMQDALINSSNSTLYGRGIATSGSDLLGGTGYTSIGTAGKFEYVVAAVDIPLTGGILKFRGAGAGGGCVNTYTNQPANATQGQRTFQVVRVPQFSNLRLTANITTPPFNGRVGGIIAFDVAGTMEFNGFTIDASARGFRGGFGPNTGGGSSVNNISNLYAAASTDTRSVGKGESIAGTPRFMWDGFNQVSNPIEGLPGGSYGRGAPANGGGGGNDHNAGGGGGGNGGFGGVGGRGWEGHPTPNTYPNGGRPGSNFTPDLTRLILGGGGGGGDANNALDGVKGGVGGGIILINVDKILGTGTIRANGGAGAPGAFGSAPDGAGGGGAGGTVFVRVLGPSAGATLNIETIGGRGGHTLNDNNDFHGPGGGGGGGFVYYNAPSATIIANVSRGTAGRAVNGTGTTHFATDGTNGQVQNFTQASLPAYLQGGGSICYPALTVNIAEENPGLTGKRNPGSLATYTISIRNTGSGGNAGGVGYDMELPPGFTMQSATVTYTGDAAGPATLTNTGTANRPSFGSFNISPGDEVIIKLIAVIDASTSEGIYHASGQATYLDPTRTSLNPARKITAAQNAFAGANITYETGSNQFVPGSNFLGTLITATTEDVHVVVPRVNFRLASSSAFENTSRQFIEVFLDETSTQTITVPYQLGVSTATENTDFLRVSTAALVFAPGETSKLISVDIYEDAVIEPDETVRLTLNNPVNARLGSVDNHIHTILNEDAEICITPLDAEKVEGDALIPLLSYTPYTFRVARAPGSYTGNAINFGARLVPSGLLDIVDFNPINGLGVVVPYTIPAGQDFVIVTIFVSRDLLVEPNKTFTVEISGSSVPISCAQAQGTIFNDDVNKIVVQFELLSSELFENEVVHKVRVILSEPVRDDERIDVRFDFVNITATEGPDYREDNSGNGKRVRIDEDEQFADIEIRIKEDNLPEGNETFRIVLTEITGADRNGYELGARTEHVVTIIDEDPIDLEDDAFETIEEIPVGGNVSLNDFEDEGQPLIYTVDMPPANGTVVINTNGTFTYTPNANFSGTETFRYRACKTSDPGSCDIANVTIIVHPLNDPPVAVNDNVPTLPEDQLATYDISVNDSDPDHAKIELRYEIRTEPANGFITDFDPATGIFTYQPKTNFVGTDFFTYQIIDPLGTWSNIATVYLNYAANNDPPVALADIYDVSECVTTINGTLANDFDTDNASSDLRYELIPGSFDASKGTITVSPTGSFTFNAIGKFTSTFYARYRVRDLEPLYTEGLLTIKLANPLLQVDEIMSPVSCFGGNDGILSATGKGGQAPYTYAWTDANGVALSTNYEITGLTAGNYTVKVTDANGCEITETFAVTQQPGMIITNTVTNLICFGDTNGAIDVTVSGGRSPYAFSWSNGATTEDLTNLTAGTYTLTITDSYGCVRTLVVPITQPAQLTASHTSTNINCFGANNGSIDLTVTGGTAPYTYVWSNSLSTQDISNLSAGIYTVEISDTNGCRLSPINITISEPAELILQTPAFNPILCFGDLTTVTLTATGGSGTNQYRLGATGTPQASNVFNNLAAGTYTFYVRDVNGCEKQQTITITQPTELVLQTPVFSPILCFGGTTSVTLTATGGSGTNQYRIGVSGTPQSSNTFNNLSAGTYIFYVTDVNGCEKQQTITITQPSELILQTPAFSPIVCFGGTTTVNLTATGGSGTYLYRNGFSGVKQSVSSFNLPAGNYTFYVTDANGCEKQQNVTIFQPTELVLQTPVFSPVLCFGGTTSVTLNATGGTGMYAYRLGASGAPQPSNVFNNISSGTYTFYVTDINGCEKQQTVTITQPTELILQTPVFSPVLCFGGTTSVTLTATGGSGTNQYRIGASGAPQSSNTFNNLAAGTYTFYVTDANGCEKQQTITINQPTELVLQSPVFSPVLCFGGTTSVTLTATGGSGTNQYRLGAIGTPQASNVFNNLAAGTYTFYVRDVNGCEKQQTITITQPTELVLQTPVFSPILCFGDLTTVTLTATGGSGTNQYRLGASGTLQPSNVFNNLAAGTYTFYVTDINGCEKQQTITITQPTELILQTPVFSPVLCFGGTTSVTLTATGGSGTNQYRLGASGTPQSSNTFNNLAAGTYTFYVTDVNGCEKQQTVTITQPTELVLQTPVFNPILCFGDLTTVTLTATGGSGTNQYRIGVSGTPQASNVFNNISAGTYTFYVRDANGCEKQQTITIAQPTELILQIPVFSHVLCFGGTTSVNLPVSGGSGNYAYRLGASGTPQASNAFNNLTAGTYTFYVRDANGCEKQQTITINQPTELVLQSPVFSPVLCFGGTTSVTIMATGGVGAYQYRLGTSGLTQTNNTFNNLTAGTYTFYVKDANDCEKQQIVTITQPTELVFQTPVFSPVLCFGGTTSVTLTASGGSGAYLYRLGTSGLTQTNNTFNNLSAGIYTFYVRDANGCEKQQTITINQPTELVLLSPVFSPILCFNGSTSVTLNASGGSGAYVYRLGISGLTQTSNTFNDLTAGTYTFYVRDANGCEKQQQITITEPSRTTLSFTKTDVKCFGDNSGSINLTVAGGTAPYTYLWSDGQSVEDPQNLVSGNYGVVVTDANGCTRSIAVIINQPQAALSGTITATNAICKNSADGSLSATISGGTAPYTYMWNDNPQLNQPTLRNIPAGTYKLTITDQNKCELILYGTVLPGNCAPVAVNDNYLNGREDEQLFGAILTNDSDPDQDVITNYRLLTALPDEAKIGRLVFNADGTFIFTPARNYHGQFSLNYQITDPAGLTAQAILTIKTNAVNDQPTAGNDQFPGTEDQPVKGNIGTNDGDEDGDILTYHPVTVLPPGTGTLVIDPKTGDFTFTPAPNFNGPVVIEYEVCDPAGACTKATITIDVAPVNDLPVAVNDTYRTPENKTLTGNVGVNDKDADGDPLTFRLTSPLPLPAYGNLVFNPDGTFTFVPNLDFNGTLVLDYEVCDANGCAPAKFRIEVLPIEVVSLTPATTIIRENGKIAITAVLSKAIFEDVTITFAYSGAATQNKDYKLTDNYVQLTILAGDTQSKAYLTINGVHDDIAEQEEDINVSINTISSQFVRKGTDAVVILTDIYPPAKTTIEETENAKLQPDPLFSPNGDGQGNEFFKIYNISNYPDNKVFIYNRWGNAVFVTENYDDDQNNFRGKSNTGFLTNTKDDLVDGVYYFVIFTTGDDGKKKINKGYIVLKR